MSGMGFTIACTGSEQSVAVKKLAQQLTFIDQSPLFGIFNNMRKAYDVMDREMCINIYVDAGEGSNAVRLIINF